MISVVFAALFQTGGGPVETSLDLQEISLVSRRMVCGRVSELIQEPERNLAKATVLEMDGVPLHFDLDFGSAMAPAWLGTEASLFAATMLRSCEPGRLTR